MSVFPVFNQSSCWHQLLIYLKHSKSSTDGKLVLQITTVIFKLPVSVCHWPEPCMICKPLYSRVCSEHESRGLWGLDLQLISTQSWMCSLVSFLMYHTLVLVLFSNCHSPVLTWSQALKVSVTICSGLSAVWLQPRWNFSYHLLPCTCCKSAQTL